MATETSMSPAFSYLFRSTRHLRNKCTNRYNTIHSVMLLSSRKILRKRHYDISQVKIPGFINSTMLLYFHWLCFLQLDQNQRVNNLLQNNRFRNYLQLNLTCNGCSLNVYYDTDSSKQVHFTDKFIIVCEQMKVKLHQFNPLTPYQC